MIVIIDCGFGNIASVLNMVKKIGADARISHTKNDLNAAAKLILPGVGAFDHGIEALHKLDLFNIVKERALSGVPLLGICLGMQLLANRSDEGTLGGFGLIDAEIKRFAFPSNSQLRIPHVGWNLVRATKPNPLLDNSAGEQRFYFTHSYHAVCKAETDVLAVTEYGYPFVSAFSRSHVYGVQFHPEKSHRFGMRLIKRFVDL